MARDDATFREEIIHAEARCMEKLLKCVMRAACGPKSDWKAAAWLLERKWWKEFSRRNPDVITADQLSASIGRVVAALLAVVPVELHDAIQTKIDEITSGLSRRHRAEEKNCT